VRAVAGEQPGALVELPQHLVALGWPRDRLPDHLGEPQVVQPRIETADMSRDPRDRIRIIPRAAAGAAGPAVLVTGGDLPGAAADRAGLCGAPPADVAI